MTDRRQHWDQAPPGINFGLPLNCYPTLLLEALPYPLFIHDHQGRFVEVNEKACHSLGYSRAELLEMSVTDVELDFDLESAQQQWRQIESGRQVVVRGRHRHKNGSCFPVEVRFSLWNEGQRRHYVCVVQEISRRQRVEGALRMNELRFRSIYEHSRIGIAVMDDGYKLLQCNPAFCDLLGYSEFELRGMELSEIVHPDDLQRDMARLEQVKTGGQSYFNAEHRYIHHSGRTVCVKKFVSAIQPEPSTAGRLMILTCDMTSLHESENALREYDNHFRATFEQAAVGICHTTMDGRLVRGNRKLALLLGYGETELTGLTLRDITPPEQWATDLDGAKQLLSNAVPHLQDERRLIRKDGSLVWVRQTISLVRKPDGEADFFISMLEDIGARRQAEAAPQAAQAERESLVKVVAAAQAATVLTRKLTQPLNALAAYADAGMRLLEAGTLQPDKLKLALEGATNEVRRSAETLQQLQELLHHGLEQTTTVPLAGILQTTIQQLEQLAAGRYSIQADWPDSLPRVTVDPRLIETVLRTLLDCNLALSPQYPMTLPAQLVTVRAGLEPGAAMARVTVTIAGTSLTAEQLDKLFDDFLIPSSQGLGIGLAACRALMKSQGGRLWADSDPASGTAFHFTLPTCA